MNENGLKSDFLQENPLEKFAIITCGGTIDKDYASCAGTYNFDFGSEPAVQRILQRINPNFSYEILSVLKKDSLDMDDADRKLVYDACRKANAKKIIITHGTDTMAKTAEKLAALKSKTIVICGAAKPERFFDSDAEFNVGAAIGAANVLSCGVYIAMNGRIYRWDECQKQKETGKFVEK